MRITPWRSRSELEQLKQWLFVDSTPASKRRAIQRIDAYISRGPYLPHIIEFTVRLIQCQLNDNSEAQDGDDMEYLKWQYCMVLIRFVNGMLDPVQQAQFAIPLHTLAENIGLPSWFVELRHLSTHERELPSLEMLRLCCKEAIQWTWDNYWNNDEYEDEDDEDGSGEDASADKVGDGGSDISQRKSENLSSLKALFSQYAGLRKLLKENEYLWKRARIARSTFGEQDSSGNEEVIVWISDLKNTWKQIDKTDFVEYMILHCDETLLEICFHSLDTVQVRCLQWLIENYEKRIKNEETKMTVRFTNYKKLLKFVNKCCSMMDGRKILNNGPFADVVNKHHSYLVIHILQTLDYGSGSTSNYNSNNSRRKKKTNEIDVRKVVEELNAKGIKDVELELYNTRKRVTSEEAEPIPEESPAFDVLQDLKELKSQFKRNKNNTQPVVNWQEVTDWTPKPFGVL